MRRQRGDRYHELHPRRRCCRGRCLIINRPQTIVSRLLCRRCSDTYQGQDSPCLFSRFPRLFTSLSLSLSFSVHCTSLYALPSTLSHFRASSEIRTKVFEVFAHRTEFTEVYINRVFKRERGLGQAAICLCSMESNDGPIE